MRFVVMHADRNFAIVFRSVLLAAFSIILTLAPSAGFGLEESSFSIATFNAEFLTRPKVHRKFGHTFNLNKAARRTWEQEGYRDKKFATATVAVAEFIATNLPADVLILTEVGNADDVGELQAVLKKKGIPYRYAQVCKCSDNVTRQHVAVLSRFQLFDIQPRVPGREGYYKELDDAESESHTGISKGMIVRFKASSRTFRLYAVHLASESGGHEKDAQRLAQASILRRHIIEALNAGEHVIVAGDLNDRRGESPLRRVRGLDDIGPDLIQTGHSRYFADGDEDKRWTYSYDGQRQQIDHILLSRSIVKSAKRIQTRAGPTPEDLVSDHRPLVVRLELR